LVVDRIKFYTDEHVPRAVTEGLRRRGVDVVTVQDAGTQGAEDARHLDFAAREGRVVLTQDADFLRLHAAGVSHAGIVYVPQQTPIREILRSLTILHELLRPEDMVRHVEFL
jgi:predicted nuclease of predicted toxin-antitoxin system